MRRSGRVFGLLAVSLLVGGFFAPPAAAQVSDVSFGPPHDGTTWHRGDVIRARIVLTVPIAESDAHPVLELVVGRNTRQVEGRIFQNGSQASFLYTVQSDDAAAPDEVRMAKASLAGADVDLSGFNPTPTRSTAAPGGFRRSSTSSGSARSSSCPPTACTVPARDLLVRPVPQGRHGEWSAGAGAAHRR